MSYTLSQAYQGQTSQLSIGPVSNTASPTYTPIYEVTECSLPAATADKIDVTNLNSLNNAKEFRKGMIDFGEMTVKGNYRPADPGQLALAAAFADPTNSYMFQLLLPKSPNETTSGDTFAFNALVMSWTVPAVVEAGKTIAFEAKLQITGSVAHTPGS